MNVHTRTFREVLPESRRGTCPQKEADMDNDIEKTNTVFDDDELDTAIANADDTGMVAQRQVVIQTEDTV